MSSKPCTLCVGCGRCETFRADIEVLTKGGVPQQLASFPCDVYRKVFGEKETIVSVDIGTTTVAMTLRRLSTGDTVGVFTALNPQGAYGKDVLSRMDGAKSTKMQQLMEETIWQGICHLKEVYNEDIDKMVITGNTTMLYLLRGRDTQELSKAPFRASFLDQEMFLFHDIETIVMPGISAFVGADVLAGMYALSMDKAAEGTILIDLGTNGEMVMATSDGFVATATPAAPAYEGSSFGESVFGADYVTMLAYLLDHGYMDETGLLADPYFEEGILVGGKRITQQDIRRLQLAKGATGAGVQILTKDCPIKMVYLAGGFGYFLDGQKAQAIGLLPKECEGKVWAVGNQALEGAFLYGRCCFANDRFSKELQDKRPLDEQSLQLMRREKHRLEDMKKRTKVLNLAMEPDFEQVYLNSLNFEQVKTRKH